MAQFFEAQERMRRGTLLTGPDAYFRDLMRNYGNGGKPIAVPKVTRSEMERANEFRRREKEYYSNLDKQLEHLAVVVPQTFNEYEAAVAGLEQRLKDTEQKLAEREKFLASRVNDSAELPSSEPDNHRRDTVLHAESSANETDGAPRGDSEEAVNSSTKATDGADPVTHELEPA
jgi:hypothetical protein